MEKLAKMRRCTNAIDWPLQVLAHYCNMIVISQIFPLLISCLVSVSTDAFQISSSDPKTFGADWIWKQELSVRTRASESSNTGRKELPPVIQQIADERAEFQINLGRAMDTLRRDMPDILSRTPGPLGCCSAEFFLYICRILY